MGLRAFSGGCNAVFGREPERISLGADLAVVANMENCEGRNGEVLHVNRKWTYENFEG